MQQKISSKDTSINTVNKVYTSCYFRPNSSVFDYGGGKYDSNVNYMLSKHVQVYVYDKYNKTQEHNSAVRTYMRTNPPDYIVCSNVLNVIMEDEVIREILDDISLFAEQATVYFAIYEGDRSGIGKPTTKGYQRNQKRSLYYDLISQYFEIKSIKSGIIICERKKV